MIEAHRLGEAMKVQDYAAGVVASEMPGASFVFVGLDEQYVYFNVVARASIVTGEQKRDIVAKTRFAPIAVYDGLIYKGEFKISY